MQIIRPSSNGTIRFGLRVGLDHDLLQVVLGSYMVNETTIDWYHVFDVFRLSHSSQRWIHEGQIGKGVDFTGRVPSIVVLSSRRLAFGVRLRGRSSLRPTWMATGSEHTRFQLLTAVLLVR